MRRMTHALLMRCASARLDRIRVAAPLRTLERQGIVKITSLLSESNIYYAHMKISLETPILCEADSIQVTILLS